jgi:uncharacterized protein YkwD
VSTAGDSQATTTTDTTGDPSETSGADAVTVDETTTDPEPTMSMMMDPDMMTEAEMSADEMSTDDSSVDTTGEEMAATDDEASDPLLQPDTTNVGDCPPAPDDAPPEAVEALRIVTEARLAAGAGCITMVSELNAAAKNHCDYYAANTGQCTADAHSEVDGCTGFTGSDPGARANYAGFSGRFAFEVMAFANDPQSSIDMWINSVWHRIPVVSPWVTEMGYGAAEGCDTIDFGRGMPAADDEVVVYPYMGQVDVPPTFHGDREGPMPPEPPTGWPSGIPINVYAQGVQITEHLLTIDGEETPIEHMWLVPEEQSLLRDEVFLYANAPLEPMTTYRVRLLGTYVGGNLDLDWTFTTGEAEPTFGGGGFGGR